ncbi:MAG: toxin-antitoxin system TumE family protein [Steroidobacteraceae bacterium]
MKARLLFRRRIVVSPIEFAELVLWQAPAPVKGSAHSYKYRLAFVVDNRCVVRYDNEAGKGDHRHYGEREQTYSFADVERLQADFMDDIRRWRDENGGA